MIPSSDHSTIQRLLKKSISEAKAVFGSDGLAGGSGQAEESPDASRIRHPGGASTPGWRPGSPSRPTNRSRFPLGSGSDAAGASV